MQCRHSGGYRRRVSYTHTSAFAPDLCIKKSLVHQRFGFWRRCHNFCTYGLLWVAADPNRSQPVRPPPWPCRVRPVRQNGDRVGAKLSPREQESQGQQEGQNVMESFKDKVILITGGSSGI